MHCVMIWLDLKSAFVCSVIITDLAARLLRQSLQHEQAFEQLL